MTKIQLMTHDHFEQRMELIQYAFQQQIPADRIEKEREVYQPGAEWGIVDEDGRLLSMLAINPLKAWIQGSAFAMGGIGCVASWPDARRQGGVSKLMLYALEKMKADGQTVSMLAPFSFPFYRKYGYELTIERKAYTLQKEHLPPRVDVPGRVKLVPKQTELFSEMYEQYASRYNGTLIRDESWWNRSVWNRPGHAAIYYSESGEAQGYLIYQIAGRTMTVHEWVELTDTARLALWSFVGNHDSMIDKLTMTAPMNDSLHLHLPDPRFKQEIQPFFMSRIVDAAGFFASYPMNPHTREESLQLKLNDSQAPWNDGTFRLDIAEGGAARLERMDNKADGLPSIECEIGALTALLVGNWNMDVLVNSGKLRGESEAIELMKRRIPNRTSYLMDGF
ncbi:GNAT family N-acetyltransferase [Paenibacillus albus]|uniref:GNAT family N-acetyltransferase n=1 Tax=Paenibacillus albus TaxID=2495582 RepID=UPI0013DF3482|nr:GNAT family N-acetyltransferase [Paenibacillus albus]